MLSKNVALSLWLMKHHAMKRYGGVEVQIHEFITSAPHGVYDVFSSFILDTYWLGGGVLGSESVKMLSI
jgi:hypothetical protein